VIWHPLTLSIWLLMVLSWIIYGPMLWRVMRVLPHWAPVASDAGQLRRERHMEWVTHQGRWVFYLQTMIGLLLIMGISSAWPSVVPGAMCGTGVLQAMGTAGVQILWFQLLAVGVIGAWWLNRQLDASQPYGPLIPAQARLLLLAAPIMALASWSWVRALMAVDGSPPVSCCAVIYDQVATNPLTGVLAPANGAHWLGACLLGVGGLTAWGAWQWRCRIILPRAIALIGAVTVLGWVVTAVVALRLGVAPYIYQTLSHPCAWCLFLPEHGAVGYLYFGLLTWIAAQDLTLGVAGMMFGRIPPLDPFLMRLQRRAGLGLMLGVLVFGVAAGWPVLAWRWRYGTWLV
jgi:hypothetical protein